MTSFYTSVFANPMFFVGLVFAFVAAIAFLVFLRGFLSGLPGLFTLSYHHDHQEHHTVRVTWGLMVLIFVFIFWELLKYTIAFLSGAVGGGLWTFILLIVLWFVLAVAPFLIQGGGH